MWELVSDISKAYYYQVEIMVQFINITNLDVKLLSGYTEETMFTVSTAATQGSIFNIPIYNKTWIVATPKNNQTTNRLKFHSYILREQSVFVEDISVRKIITTAIIVAGLVIFLGTMSGVIIYRRIKDHVALKKGKMSIAPHRGET